MSVVRDKHKEHLLFFRFCLLLFSSIFSGFPEDVLCTYKPSQDILPCTLCLHASFDHLYQQFLVVTVSTPSAKNGFQHLVYYCLEVNIK